MGDRSEYHRQWYLKNKAKKSEQGKDYYSKNKARKNKASRGWYQSHQDYVASRHYKQTYGLHYYEVQELLELQNNVCAVCSKPISIEVRPKTAHVDHDHLTGKLRGLLCSKCNVSMAVIDDPSYLELLLFYKEENRG